jgi:hypothetical protein
LSARLGAEVYPFGNGIIPAALQRRNPRSQPSRKVQ